MEFKYDGGGTAKGGTVTLYVDGKKDGEARVDRTVPMVFGTETCDIGEDAGAPVSSDYACQRQPVLGSSQLGADRPGKGRSGPPDFARRALPACDGAAVNRTGDRHEKSDRRRAEGRSSVARVTERV